MEREAAKKPDGLLQRKIKRIFGALGDVRTQFIQGFKMGAIVGGIFGGLTGLYYAVTTRTFWYIPMIMFTSGGSFGFFMGVGMIMRSEMEPAVEKECDDFMVAKIDKEEGAISREPVYKRYLL